MLMFKSIPATTSFKRGYVVSDGLMFQDVHGEILPVQVKRQGIRGTQNVNGSDQKSVTNIQMTDVAKLHHDSNTLVVRFQMSFLDLSDAIQSCASGTDNEAAKAFRESVAGFIERAKASKGLEEVARRMARNILNGRWLFRTRKIASRLEVRVRVVRSDGELEREVRSAEGLKIPLHTFDSYSEAEIFLANEISSQVRGDSLSTLDVEARLTARCTGAEVFPSQNYLGMDKGNSAEGFSRSLYKVGSAESTDEHEFKIMGQAAIRDQKISNAIRTIDTWYPAFKEEGLAIPVEPMGANIDAQEFFRKGEASAFQLFKSLNAMDPDSPEGMFAIACLQRGGVYGESEKEKSGEKSAGKTKAAGKARKSEPAPALDLEMTF